MKIFKNLKYLEQFMFVFRNNLRRFWLLLALKTHFETFQPAVIPLEAQNSNASTVLLKHVFQNCYNENFQKFFQNIFFELSAALLNQNEALKFDTK